MAYMIMNDGPDIAHTDYYDSDFAQAGLILLTVNAGALRILIPDQHVGVLDELRTGKVCVITEGMMKGRDMLELMFDDGSKSPMCLHIEVEMCIPAPAPTDHGKQLLVTAWTREGKQAEWPGLFRVGDTLPDMRPWAMTE